jgi:hypothetical protein
MRRKGTEDRGQICRSGYVSLTLPTNLARNLPGFCEVKNFDKGIPWGEFDDEKR